MQGFLQIVVQGKRIMLHNNRGLPDFIRDPKLTQTSFITISTLPQVSELVPHKPYITHIFIPGITGHCRNALGDFVQNIFGENFVLNQVAASYHDPRLELESRYLTLEENAQQIIEALNRLTKNSKVLVNLNKLTLCWYSFSAYLAPYVDQWAQTAGYALTHVIIDQPILPVLQNLSLENLLQHIWKIFEITATMHHLPVTMLTPEIQQEVLETLQDYFASRPTATARDCLSDREMLRAVLTRVVPTLSTDPEAAELAYDPLHLVLFNIQSCLQAPINDHQFSKLFVISTEATRAQFNYPSAQLGWEGFVSNPRALQNYCFSAPEANHFSIFTNPTFSLELANVIHSIDVPHSDLDMMDLLASMVAHTMMQNVSVSKRDKKELMDYFCKHVFSYYQRAQDNAVSPRPITPLSIRIPTDEMESGEALDTLSFFTRSSPGKEEPKRLKRSYSTATML